MSVALTGFLTGFAKGAKERVEKEKEENEALIANRLKTAATNRLLRQKEVEAQKQLLKDRLESVSAFLPPDATEEQKLALVSNKEIADTFVAARKDNPNLDVNKFLVVNKDKVPKNFTSVQQYLDTISASPTPVAQEQIDTIRQTQGAFGARVGANVEKMAQQYGVSAGELLAYEQPMTTPELPQFASINLETLRDLPSADKILSDAKTEAFNAVTEFGKDSPEAKAAITKFNDLQNITKAQEEVTAEVRLGRVTARMASLDSKSPEYKQLAGERDRLNALVRSNKAAQRIPGEGDDSGYNESKIAATVRNIRQAQAAALERAGLVKDNVVMTTSIDGSITFTPKNSGGFNKAVTDIMDSVARDYLAPIADKPYAIGAKQILLRPVEPLTPAPAPVIPPAAAPVTSPPRAEQRTTVDGKIVPPTTKTVTRAQVQAVAASKGVTFNEAADAARSQGFTIKD